MDVELLRTGEPAHVVTILKLSDSTHLSAAGRVRRIPLLTWDQTGQMVRSRYPPGVIQADAMVETTDVSGKRTVALKVKDDSMEPMFSHGEIFL
jgi:phage repressor protein C with HTH and peptisase S24 domain